MLICLVVACITKRAQIPFSVWLPLAIAAPTPVSSLVHSSTLVTSGVYLLIRFDRFIRVHFVFEYLFIVTLLLSRIRACLENDLKKIIALSTLSQLSLIMVILIEGFADICFFHLLIHAIFKCLLFLCSGNIIHNYASNQDIRLIGVFVGCFPVLTRYLNISLIVLIGLPFLSAFYSKDYFLEIIYTNSFLNLFIMIVVYISVALTVAYSLRLIYLLNLSFNIYIS